MPRPKEKKGVMPGELALYDVRVGRFEFKVVARSELQAMDIVKNIEDAYNDGEDMVVTGDILASLPDYLPVGELH